MLEVRDLVGRLGDVIGAFSARVWQHTTALQHARGLTATPYILCGVTVGAHLSAHLSSASNGVFARDRVVGTSTRSPDGIAAHTLHACSVVDGLGRLRLPLRAGICRRWHYESGPQCR